MHSHDTNWPMHSHNIGEEAADVGAVGNAAPAGRPEPASPYPPSNAQRELLPVPAELRPPLKHHGKPFHFIQTAACVPQVARWDGWRWQVWSPALWTWVEAEPSELGHWGYLGPAEWQPTPEPEPDAHKGKQLVPLAQIKASSEMMADLLKRCTVLREQRDALAFENNDLATKRAAAEDLAERWRAEVEKLDPGRFAPAKPAFPANALKHSA